MFNMTGGELVIIFMAALVVLGPEKLPEAARFIGRMMSQVRDVSQGFQKELRSAMDEVSEPVSKLRNPGLNYLDGADLPDTRIKPKSAEMANAEEPEGKVPFVQSAPTVPEPVVDWAAPVSPIPPPTTPTGAAPPFAPSEYPEPTQGDTEVHETR
ncbi:MAG: twin-arginine translocase TatA/TatE family subunit [Acidimicrobiales bacterium]